MAATPALKKALNQRQLRMIAIGGVIGAGLFVGSGVVMGDTGPGAFITYALSGVLIVMVMRMLAEMAVANPSTGSFADYSRDALGHWAGFSVGWLYWYFWVIVVGFEAIAGAKIVQYWIHIPLWLCALAFMVLMTATNLFSVKSYGEFEFWFAGIKVAAILAFIAHRGLFRPGPVAQQVRGLLQPHQPRRVHADGRRRVTVGIVTVIFSMVGPEIATIAAAESSDPEKAVARAANSVIMRILVFYVVSVFLVVTIVPWNDKGLAASPFVAAFTKMGIPYADDIMNAVVLTAVLSCLNSGMYTASRMLFVLAARREAPALLVRVTGRGVPANAILFSSIVGFACVIAAAFAEDTIFAFLLNSSGAIILFVYLLIAVSQIVLRYRNGGARLRLKMWLFPVLSILTIAAMLAILVQMYLDDKLRSQLLLSLLSWAVVVALYFVTSGSTPIATRTGRRPRLVPRSTKWRDLQRDVLVPAAAGGGLGEHLGELAAGVRRVDLLVDHAELDGAVHATGDPLVLERQLLVQRLTLVVRRGGQLLLVQDADRGLGAHHGDLGVRPGEHRGGTQRPRVHRDVGPAVDLSRHQRHPRHARLAEGVQQLGAASHDAAPLLVHTGQVARHVDDDDQRDAEGVAQPHQTCCLLGTFGVQAAAEAKRVVGQHTDAAAGQPADADHDRRRPLGLELLERGAPSSSLSSSASTSGCTS